MAPQRNRDANPSTSPTPTKHRDSSRSFGRSAMSPNSPPQADRELSSLSQSTGLLATAPTASKVKLRSVESAQVFSKESKRRPSTPTYNSTSEKRRSISGLKSRDKEKERENGGTQSDEESSSGSHDRGTMRSTGSTGSSRSSRHRRDNSNDSNNSTGERETLTTSSEKIAAPLSSSKSKKPTLTITRSATETPAAESPSKHSKTDSAGDNLASKKSSGHL